MLRTSVAVLSAAVVVAGTFLPWRVTAHRSQDGWETADLAIGVADGLGRPGLRLVALALFLVPLGAACSVAGLLLLEPPASVAVARWSGVVALTAAVVAAAALRSEPLGGAVVGPAVVVPACALLVVAAWSAARRPVVSPRIEVRAP